MLVSLKNFSLSKWLEEVSGEDTGNFLGLVTVSGKRVRIEVIGKSHDDMSMIGKVILNEDGSEYITVKYNEKGEALEVNEIHSKLNNLGTISSIDLKDLSIKMKYEDKKPCNKTEDNDEYCIDEEVDMFIDNILGDAIDELYDTLSYRLKVILNEFDKELSEYEGKVECKCKCDCKESKKVIEEDEDDDHEDGSVKAYVNMYYSKDGKLRLSEVYSSEEEARKKASPQVKYEEICAVIYLPCPLKKK